MTEDADSRLPEEPFPDAGAVIDAFGGVRPMASKTGIAATTIQGWKSRGSIPPARHRDVRDRAAAAGIDLSALPVAPAAGPGDPEPDTGDPVEVVEAASAGNGETAERTSEPSPVPPPPAPRQGGGVVAWLALLAAVAVGAALYTQPQWAPLVHGPAAPGGAAVPDEILSRLDALEAKPAPPSLAPVRARLDALDAALKNMPALAESGPDLTPRLEELSAALERGTERLDALSARLDQAVQAVRGDARTATEALRTNLATLRDEVSALRTGLEDLRAREAAATGRTTGFALAVVSLEQAVRDGAPFADALAAVERLAPDDTAVDGAIAVLAPDATAGIPTVTALVRRFDAISTTLGETIWPETGLSWADKMLEKVDSVISIRRTEGPDGNALPARRAEQAVSRGDLEAAVAALGTAEGPAADWVADAKRRIAADKAVATLRLRAVEVLGTGLSGPGAPQ